MAILRAIRGLPNPTSSKVQSARSAFERSIHSIIQDLNWREFEELIGLILVRSGWERRAKPPGVQEGIDFDVKNQAIGERAFVQVKSKATQKDFDKYLSRWKQNRERYQRMIFAVHSPSGTIRTSNRAVQIWTIDKIAQLVVQLGLVDSI